MSDYIYNYTVDQSLKPTHTTKNVPILIPVSQLNSSRTVLQYNMNTLSTLYIFFM